MKDDDELKHQRQAEEGRKMHNFTVVRGAKLELTDLRINGVLVQISNPNDVDDCVSILLRPTDANMITSWLEIYRAKHRGPADGKKSKEKKAEKENNGGD